MLIFMLVLQGCEEKDFYSSKANDEQELYSKKREIEKMAESVSCENSTGWKFTVMGVKSCGGAAGYIAYSNQLDEVLFLKKVALYNQKQNAFLVKWGMMSDCSIALEPKSVTCVDGKPKFVY